MAGSGRAKQILVMAVSEPGGATPSFAKIHPARMSASRLHSAIKTSVMLLSYVCWGVGDSALLEGGAAAARIKLQKSCPTGQKPSPEVEICSFMYSTPDRTLAAARWAKLQG